MQWHVMVMMMLLMMTMMMMMVMPKDHRKDRHQTRDNNLTFEG